MTAAKKFLTVVFILMISSLLFIQPAEVVTGAWLPADETMPVEGGPGPETPISQPPVNSSVEANTVEAQELSAPFAVPAHGQKPAHYVLDKPLAQYAGTSKNQPPVEKTGGQNGPMLPAAWAALMYEGFEGSFPSDGWVAFDYDGLTNNEYYWDDVNTRSYGGDWSAWAANGGANGRDPSSSYPDDAQSWMVYGPFSLADALDADLQFSYWNQSEQGYDFFGWAASTDAVNFYGYKVSGDSGGWVNENFDLTDVPALGNLSGVEQVWIAFTFTSDGSIVGAGPFVDDILLQRYTEAPLPDFAYYTPGGWSNPIVPSSITGTNTTSDLYSYQNTYVDWAVINQGESTSVSFYTCLYLDGVEQACWTHTGGLLSGYYASFTDFLLSSPPAGGWHTLRLVADATNVINEVDESNNTWEGSYYWDPPTQPDIIPYTPEGWDYPIVPSSVTGTTTVGALNNSATYLDWAVMNSGTTTTTPFYSCIYLDGTEIVCSTHTGGLQQTGVDSLLDYLYSGYVSPGSHTLRLVADAYEMVEEANENNNTWEHGFTWPDPCPSSSYSPAFGEMGGTVMADTFPRPSAVQNRIDIALTDLDPRSNTPQRYDTSSYLAGTVAVGIVLPESTGSMEDWTESETNCVVSKIQTGLDWWKNRAGDENNLSFVYDVHPAVSTQYEPIDHNDSQIGLWIDETMTNLGFAGSDYFEQVYDYTDYLRTTYQTQWAVVYFVADSSNDADGRFKDSQYFGWTYLGGPFIIMTYDNDGWGIRNMNWVAAHEFGHDFGAGDQYYAPGYGGCQSTTQRFGYLGIANSNCEYNNPASVPSLMRSNENALDASAAGQIGWLDSNGNGIDDVIDTHPSFDLSSHAPNPTIETAWSYDGYVFDQPWPHAQCGYSDVCAYQDITINTIASVEFRIDGGEWQAANAVDGAFDSDFEQIAFTTPSMAPGTHTIEVQAENSRGAAGSWSDTVDVEECYALTTAANPAYAGSVSASAPTCGDDLYAPGTQVTLTASSNPGYSFSGWSGDAVGATASTTVMMSENRSVTANFNNRVPSLNSISPTSTVISGSGFTLTLNGLNFVQGSVARWNGADLTTTYVSSSQLTASVPAENIVAVGTASVTVFNPLPGGGTSNNLAFAVNNPAPTVSAILPTAVLAGGGDFVLTVNGEKFIPASRVRWNGAEITTTFVSSTQLSAAVPASFISTPGTKTITVYNPAPGGGTSTGASLTVNNPAPSVSGISPSEAPAGSAGFTITVDGTNFVPGSTVRWKGANLTTTYVSSTQLSAAVPAGSLVASGSAAVTVSNPSPGGGVSNSMTFTISSPLPVLTGVTPKVIHVGSGGVMITVTGSNFVQGVKIRWNGEELPTTYVNATTLKAVVPGANLASCGVAVITVGSPAPSGDESNGVEVEIVENGVYLPYLIR